MSFDVVALLSNDAMFMRHKPFHRFFRQQGANSLVYHGALRAICSHKSTLLYLTATPEYSNRPLVTDNLGITNLCQIEEWLFEAINSLVSEIQIASPL